MPLRTDTYAVIHANIGRHTRRQFPCHAVESYAYEVAIDNDVDAFSLDIGDPNNEFRFLLDRDTEVEAVIYMRDVNGNFVRMFTGIGDVHTKSNDDMILSIQGSDMSTLALGDAPPGKWTHIQPASWIADRAQGLGFPKTRIHRVSELSRLVTDGSETEWALWYRVARERNLWLWTEPNGDLIGDRLAYGAPPSYYFGRLTTGVSNKWIPVEKAVITTNHQGRVGEVWVYGEDAKTKKAFRPARGIDTTITKWRRRPIKIITSTTAKKAADLQKEADTEVFESIVGAFEIELTIQDTGVLVHQNRMARVNIPEFELSGEWYVVGVRSQGGQEGKTQVVRLRQKGFALSKRVPTTPVIKTTQDPGTSKIPGSVTAALKSAGDPYGVRWADCFVNATRAFATPNGWDFALFLGVLLAICQKESGFANLREPFGGPEWQPEADYVGKNAVTAATIEIQRQDYIKAFSNDKSNPKNPFYPTRGAGVGPMQLTDARYKDWADQYGWSGASAVGELNGGRWNPCSNIRAAARVLIEKLNTAPKVDPSGGYNSIWIGVARYNGSDAYGAAVKALYDQTWGSVATSTVAQATTLPVGTQTAITIPGSTIQIEVPPDAPDAVKKAVNFCEKRLGDPYQWGGGGPLYDCSSLVTAAFASAAAFLRDELDEPYPGHHGESTLALWKPGRFTDIPKDQLLAGDLVFFNNQDHVGMYVNDNYFIHDPHSGDHVRFSSLGESWYRDNYDGARRLVAWYGT